MFTGKKKGWLLFFALIFVSYLFLPGKVDAIVFASSDMDLFNLNFSSPDPMAELLWTDEWYGTVSAHAYDTDSGSADDFDDLYGNDGSISAIANTAHVHSKADYSVVMGDMVAIENDASIQASAHSDLELYDVGQGDGDATADFDNFFTIIGGNPGDPVDITFTLDYSGQLTGEADVLGYFSIALGALLQLEDISGNLLDEDSIFEIHSGTNTYFHDDYNDFLTVSATLFYEDEYWLYAGADSEVYGANAVPEPGTLFLLLLSVPFLIRKKGWKR
jgi:hypothetical protein